MGNQLSTTLPEDWATIDMVNRFTFCPRLFHLMYREGRWADNLHTIEGKAAHRRVDRIDQLLPESDAPPDAEPAPEEEDGDDPPEVARSVSLGSDTLGLMGKLDLVSADPSGREAAPVETKKGRVPNVPERSYPPERAQLMAQALLLREHGYTSDHGYLYFVGSRTRVRVDFTPELEAETRATIAAIRLARAATVAPEPLVDSPKCWGCSLCGICLPDETRFLRDSAHAGVPVKDIRRLYPARDHAVPFYVQEQGARVGKSHSRLTVKKSGEAIGEARLTDTSHLVLCGNVGISAQALNLLLDEGRSVVHLSTGGWFHGISHGHEVENAYARAAQYAAAADPAMCRRLAAELVLAKARNQRALLQRNASSPEASAAVNALADRIKRFRPDDFASLDTLRGWEGHTAALYFKVFTSMLKSGELEGFDFTARNRRPPKDPVNALLSYTYALLAKECSVALLGEGLDPWWGLYHVPRHGRPALALDLMEPFRAILGDSVVITAINTGMVTPRHFAINSNGCAMQPAGRKGLLRAWEQRLDQLYTHPLFNYRCSWRTMLRIQARLLVRWLRGDIPEWTCPVVR
jgi:CRISPR-associated endonuclease Cas1/CRISPR-associated protein Cas4